ncbi:MAG: metallophosphoesterase [Pirellulales bacterium]
MTSRRSLPRREFLQSVCAAGLAPSAAAAFAQPPAAQTSPAAPAAKSTSKFQGSKPLPPLPEGAFTVVVIPDTQHYVGARTKRTPDDTTTPVTNPHLEAQVRWIREHAADQNIAFVSHVGDIVDEDDDAQWAVAKQHLDTLRGVVPFGLTVGNHDMSTKGNAHLFQQAFPAASFRQYPWYLGCYEHERADQRVSADNVNSAQLFTAGGLEFLFLHLECNAPDDVLAWADGLLTKYADRRALITTHMDLGIRDKPKTKEGYIHDPKGRMRWVKIHGPRGNTAEQLWDKLFRKHANIGLIFCGDQSRVTALRLTTPADDGHPVTSLLSDYMSEPVLRLCRFVPSADRVDVLSWHVTQEFLIERSNYVPDLAQHQFSLPYDLKPKSAAR